MNGTPAFIQDSRLLDEAYELAIDAHHGARRRTDTNIDHPAAVGALLHQRGFEDEVVAAGLLHDVLEDTQTDGTEIVERFGPDVGDLVDVMTEDASIEDYEERKAEHRARVARHSRRAAAIYAADKLAKTNSLRDRAGSVPDAKLRHYRQTLIDLRDTYPELPFLPELEEGLQAINAQRKHVTRR